MYQTQIPYVKGLTEELAKLPLDKLDNVTPLDSGAVLTEVITAFNNLVADLKEKGLMKTV